VVIPISLQGVPAYDHFPDSNSTGKRRAGAPHETEVAISDPDQVDILLVHFQCHAFLLETIMTAKVPVSSLPAYRTILRAGLVAGSLDIGTQAVLFALRGRSPVYLLQLVAGGLLGQSSFQRGWPAAALGLACHFLIALTAAAVFYVASRRLTFLVRRAVLCGLLYGIAVFAFMRYVVLPLSAFHLPLTLPSLPILIREVAVHMLMVGLPISLIVRRYSPFEKRGAGALPNSRPNSSSDARMQEHGT
jgi:hypothetical protein